MTFERVYCGNCGKLEGLVTAEWTPHVFYLCETCARTSPPAGCIEVPPPPGTIALAALDDPRGPPDRE